MIALGLCNIFGSFVRSMPTAGSFTRTAVNNASGVRTPMGGILTGCIVLMACGLLTSTFRFIPKASLAAVIIVAMYYMLELHIFYLLWKTKSKLKLWTLKISMLRIHNSFKSYLLFTHTFSLQLTMLTIETTKLLNALFLHYTHYTTNTVSKALWILVKQKVKIR